MINRVLIRTKVVQMLYSYMLNRNERGIEAAPEGGSRDSKYAYTVYCRLLMVLLELSGYSVRAGQSPIDGAKANRYLHDNIVARALSSDDTLRRMILRGTSGIDAYDSILNEIYSRVIKSEAYRSYQRKRSRTETDDADLWTALIPTTIAGDSDFVAATRRADGDEFTLKGFDMGVQMAVDTVTAVADTSGMLGRALSSLQRSLDKAYELYHLLLLLPVAITRIEAERIEEASSRYMASASDRNPNMRFVENELVKAIEENEQMKEYVDDTHITWDNEPLMLRRILDNIKKTDAYREYMEAKYSDYEADCELWRTLMRTVILPSDELAEVLENSSVYWNDDLEIVGTFVLKSIKHFASARTEKGTGVELLPEFKDEEDARFGADLMKIVVDNRDEYRQLIDRFINAEQWDSERLALMDIIVMMAAIAEMLHYPLIPLAVTLNEYIEIANSYSTPRSGQFINGILTSVIKYLRQEGKLQKELPATKS